MADVLEQLLPVKFRDVEFPITKLRTSVAHDLVEHKYWGVDGARVESTGLAPRRISCSSPMTNGIVPGKAERWAVLYPNTFRDLFTAFQMKATGPFQHPEFGIINVKAERMEADWDANRRGGVDVELSFVETLPEEGIDLFEDSPVQEIELAALNLDASDLKVDLEKLLRDAGLPLPPYLEKDTISLSDIARKVQGVVDTATLLEHRVGGAYNSLLYQANRIQQSCERLRDATTWPITRDVERIRSSAHELRQKLLQADRDVAFFRVPADTTLAGVVRQLDGASVGDIIKLNPSLMTNPVVSEGTVVRYYVPRVAAA